MEPPVPHEKEEQRLHDLNQYGLVDTLAEESFDRIVAIAAEIFDTPIALFTLIDRDRQWFKSRVGLDVEETARTISFCGHAVASSDFLLVEDTEKDARFTDNPLVTGAPHIRFYAGMPIFSADDLPLGTLCVIDRKPRIFNSKSRMLLESLAREIESKLEIRRISAARRRLVEERAVLINMVSHDAKSIFSALGWSIDAFKKEHGSDSQSIHEFQNSINMLGKLCQSMIRINNNDSEGLTADARPVPLKRMLEFCAARAGAATKRANMNLATNIQVPEYKFVTDSSLVDRIVGNLHSNAVQACGPGASIRIDARLDDNGDLLIIIEDDGPGIPENSEQQIFEPFFSQRADGSEGDGLGLPICRLAATALGGTIQYAPVKPSGARFTVRIPESSEHNA